MTISTDTELANEVVCGNAERKNARRAIQTPARAQQAPQTKTRSRRDSAPAPFIASLLVLEGCLERRRTVLREPERGRIARATVAAAAQH